MKKHLLALLALVLFVIGCPSNAPQVDASDFALAGSVDAAFDAAPHRLGSFNPTCTATGVPRVVSGVQQSACTLGSGLQVLRTNAGATDIEWATPAGGSTPTGTGFTHITAGAQDGASKKVDLTAAADVTVPSTANGVVTSSGTALQQPANVLAGSGFISVGATPAASGGVRVRNGVGFGLNGKNSGGTDVTIAEVNPSDGLNLWGTTAAYGNLDISIGAGAAVRMQTASVSALSVSGTQIIVGVPVIGWSTQYSVHGKTTVATTGTFTLAAADYSLDAIMLSGGTAGTVTFPAPGTDAAAYYKTVINTSGVVKTLTDGGASTPTLATATTGRYLFDTAGVHLTGASVAYP